MLAATLQPVASYNGKNLAALIELSYLAGA
jgi:hypothetical protein